MRYVPEESAEHEGFNPGRRLSTGLMPMQEGTSSHEISFGVRQTPGGSTFRYCWDRLPCSSNESSRGMPPPGGRKDDFP